MALFEFRSNDISQLRATTFGGLKLRERQDMQRLLRDKIEVIAPDTLLIAEEFSDWDDSRSRIDLLGIDKNANIVVIELKRTEDGGHMDLQAIRYAAFVSKMTFEQAVAALERFRGSKPDGHESARDELLRFLDWDEPDESQFGQGVRLLLASAEFSKELTTSVLWLIEQGLDIRCIRMRPYEHEGRAIVDVQQVIPLPEAAEYQVRVQTKAKKERESKSQDIDRTKYSISVAGSVTDGLPKRNAIYHTCRSLVNCGVDPEEIGRLLNPRRPDRIWRTVAGEVGSEQFVILAAEQSASRGSEFDPRRWFLGEDFLVKFDGKTHAFSNQWGGDRWESCMNKLKEKYATFDIGFWPSNSD